MTDTCRLCLDESPTEQLITPCVCSGSIRYVHKNCIRDEMEFRLNCGIVSNLCTICKEPYNVKVIHEPYPLFTLPIIVGYIVRESTRSEFIAMCLVIYFLNWMILTVPFFGFTAPLHIRRFIKKLHRFALIVTVASLIHPLPLDYLTWSLPVLIPIYFMKADVLSILLMIFLLIETVMTQFGAIVLKQSTENRFLLSISLVLPFTLIVAKRI